MALPVFQTTIRELSMLQTSWTSQLNPLLADPFLQGVLLSSVSLASGANTINTTLGRALKGWVLTRVRASATVYDTQDSNTNPSQTLLLTASAPVVVDLYVF
jgi:hypothetical protein